ncbi:helix-turn-helix domain-containing protein [Enterocloster clostridioformis]|uniref:helix-turn-helix domain-containing protein n=1 Tax=Enterocloster clostridioformis TaxID=1531 RepID=UPI00156D9C94|nr:helix-turn-helix domain-containing protein [Enterocloster clostridioformis]NSJ56005.1 helix-turn-helix domain-containing protein [Enterocloster clostridioformis]
MNGANFNDDERGLLPFPVILAATKGDPDAMKVVLQHYQSYIAHLSMTKIRDESGNIYWGIDEDLRERLQAKLMQAVLNFKVYKD